MCTVVALGPVACYTNGTGSQLTTINIEGIIITMPYKYKSVSITSMAKRFRYEQSSWHSASAICNGMVSISKVRSSMSIWDNYKTYCSKWQETRNIP